MRKLISTLVLISIVSFIFAQDHYILRDITPNMSIKKPPVYTLDIFNGLSFPQGDLNDFLKDGFNSGVLIHKRFGKKLSIGLSANHSRFNHKLSLGPVQASSRQELSTTSFDIGPQYKMTFGRFAIEFYGRSGLSIVNSPQLSKLYSETDVVITNLEAYKSTALTTRLGANMTANISEGLDLYFSSEYLTSLNSDMNYQTRDLSEAMREDGSFDADLANQLPYSNETLSLSMLNVNIGIRISIGSVWNKRKSKPLYRPYGNLNLMAEGLRFRPIPECSSGGTQVQEHSVRQSKKSSHTHNVEASDTIQIKKNGVLDYKLRRSDNSSITAPKPDESETRLESESSLEEDASLADIPDEKLKLKTNAQLAKERRKRKRIERRLKRLKTKL